MNSIRDLEQFHFRCQQGMYFSEYLEFPKYVAVFSDTVEDSYWNYVAWLSPDSEQDFVLMWKDIRKLFVQRRRVPSVYISPSSSPFYWSSGPVPASFKKLYTDSWMLLRDSTFHTKYKYPTYVTVERVDPSIQREEFVRTFLTAYKSDNPEDAYPNLPDYYATALRLSFDRTPEGFDVEHYWAKIDGRPVGVASVLIKDETAGVYGAGTVREHRKRGVGTSLTVHIIRSCLSRGVRTLLLQTEHGSRAEDWYKDMGFETVSLGRCYTETK